MRNNYLRILAVCAAALLFSGCAPEAEAPAETSSESQAYTLSPADLTTQHEQIQEIFIDENSQYQITQPGAYRFTGQQEGQICVDVQDEIVYLILDNLELHSNNGPAIYVKSAAKVVVTIPEGTESTLSDSAYYGDFPEAKACLFSSSDLTINGTGSLQVSGYFGDAIRTKDYLKILGTAATVRAKGDALRGNDGVALENATLDLQCEDTGIHATRTNKPGRGYVAIQGGSLSIIAGQYGIKASENLYLQDCTADISGILDDLSIQGRRYIQEGCLQ